MRVLPIQAKLQIYYSCCGKTTCAGCDHRHEEKTNCAFCRTPVPRSDNEILARNRKRAELNDPDALVNLAMHYGRGELGLRVDEAKCIELLRKAVALGFPRGHYQLGKLYGNGEVGLQRDAAKAKMHWEKAAEGGHLLARHNLGSAEWDNGNLIAALRHWKLSASGGFKLSVTCLLTFFERGMLHHFFLAEVMPVFYRSRAEMKSDDRDKYIAHLKVTGEYREEYEY